MTVDATERDDVRPTMLLVTGDLFLGSRLRGVGEAAGYRVVTVPRFGATSDGPPARIVIDLSTPGIDAARIMELVGPDAAERIAAYAPHVRVDLLKAARTAGLRAVFTRGQLETALPRWLGE